MHMNNKFRSFLLSFLILFIASNITANIKSVLLFGNNIATTGVFDPLITFDLDLININYLEEGFHYKKNNRVINNQETPILNININHIDISLDLQDKSETFNTKIFAIKIHKNRFIFCLVKNKITGEIQWGTMDGLEAKFNESMTLEHVDLATTTNNKQYTFSHNPYKTLKGDDKVPVCKKAWGALNEKVHFNFYAADQSNLLNLEQIFDFYPKNSSSADAISAKTVLAKTEEECLKLTDFKKSLSKPFYTEARTFECMVSAIDIDNFFDTSAAYYKKNVGYFVCSKSIKISDNKSYVCCFFLNEKTGQCKWLAVPQTCCGDKHNFDLKLNLLSNNELVCDENDLNYKNIEKNDNLLLFFETKKLIKNKQSAPLELYKNDNLSSYSSPFSYDKELRKSSEKLMAIYKISEHIFDLLQCKQSSTFLRFYKKSNSDDDSYQAIVYKELKNMLTNQMIDQKKKQEAQFRKKLMIASAIISALVVGYFVKRR